MRWSFALLVSILLLSLSHAEEALFDSDPKHLWNRLHRHLYARTTPDGKLYDQEGLEPVFLRRSTFLTKGVSYEQAIKRLDEFLKQNAETFVDDPLKRAILQRDLLPSLLRPRTPCSSASRNAVNCKSDWRR